MIILGIDPGTTRVGFGLLNTTPSKPAVLSWGCFNFEEIAESERLRHIAREVEALIKKERPAAVAVEKVFFTKNKKTALAVSEARGVIIETALSAGVPVESYTPSEVKRAVGADVRTGKKGVKKMVCLLLGLGEELRSDDAADALAVALCSAFRTGIHNRG